MQNLEDIDDDADAVGVRMVKTDDAEFAQFIGLTEFPSIVYYEHGNPHIYDGKLWYRLSKKDFEFLKPKH